MAGPRRDEPEEVQELAEVPFEAEREAFNRQRASLLRLYEGQFVELYQGGVMGHGPDDEVLARQTFERWGDVPFYIAKVEQSPTVYDLPLPEAVRR